MADAIAVSTTVSSQLEVSSALNTLISDNGIVSDKIIEQKSKSFGANQFLVTVLYST